MALKIQIREKPCVEWNVVVPRINNKTDSPDFRLEGECWYFSLATSLDSNYQEKWTMRLWKRVYAELPKKFLLTVHVRSKKNDHLFVTYKEITQEGTVIWCYNQDTFLQKHPQIELDDRNDVRLTFVFTFDYGIRDYTDIPPTEREHKSVQTSPYLDDHLCLRNLSLDLRKMMDEGSNPDVQLRCGDSIFPAHRLILGARSEVFRAMLQSGMVEGREGSVEIVDMDPKLFEILIRYIYSGILPELTEDIALLLYEAGDKYNLESLIERCGDFLAENLTLENACGILAVASSHSDEDLKDRVVSYIVEKKIPKNKAEWRKFCDEYPKLAVEVLNHAYELSN